MYIVGRDYCPWCNKAKQLLKNRNIKHDYLLLNNQFADYMKKTYNYHTIPMVFKENGEFIGGYDALEATLRR